MRDNLWITFLQSMGTLILDEKQHCRQDSESYSTVIWRYHYPPHSWHSATLLTMAALNNNNSWNQLSPSFIPIYSKSVIWDIYYKNLRFTDKKVEGWRGEVAQSHRAGRRMNRIETCQQSIPEPSTIHVHCTPSHENVGSSWRDKMHVTHLGEGVSSVHQCI